MQKYTTEQKVYFIIRDEMLLLEQYLPFSAWS